MRPAWLDPGEYPFASHELKIAAGRMHYVDEGAGPTIVMVHGLPTWSFLYRHLIKGLAPRFRCVAPDHLGFGRSETPDAFSYRVPDHATNLETFIEALGLRDVTLMVHDFGGPIGLAYALRHPDRVRRLVVMNTWMWSLRHERRSAWLGALVAGRVGRWLYLRANFSPRVMVRQAFADRARLTRTIHRHYLAPFPDERRRRVAWLMACGLIGESEWYDTLWSQRERIRGIPTLLAWGMKDRAFRADTLERWQALFTTKTVLQLANVGHFPQEEAATVLVPRITDFLTSPA